MDNTLLLVRVLKTRFGPQLGRGLVELSDFDSNFFRGGGEGEIEGDGGGETEGGEMGFYYWDMSLYYLDLGDDFS